jgi:TDG/mug DNA glycosylase family protein
VTRPTAHDLAEARNRSVADVIARDLRILFVGINPGLWSGATGFHFARPGNRFWRAIHEAGLTPTLLSPADQHELLGYGLGVTNLVARTTASAAELTSDELRGGAQNLTRKIALYGPAKVAFLGVSTYRTAFGRPKALVGRQEERIGNAEVWVLPNPSGLNAHYQLPDLARAYGALVSVPARMNFLTLACRDVERMATFFRALGWPEAPSSEPVHRVFQLTNGVVLALYGAHHYERDYGPLTDGFRGFTLGINLASRAQVLAIHETLKAVDGVTALDDPADSPHGFTGFSFRDPEGNIWDVAWKQGSTVDEAGALTWA